MLLASFRCFVLSNGIASLCAGENPGYGAE
jgi:hypothetical protein